MNNKLVIVLRRTCSFCFGILLPLGLLLLLGYGIYSASSVYGDFKWIIAQTVDLTGPEGALATWILIVLYFLGIAFAFWWSFYMRKLLSISPGNQFSGVRNTVYSNHITLASRRQRRGSRFLRSTRLLLAMLLKDGKNAFWINLVVGFVVGFVFYVLGVVTPILLAKFGIHY